MGKNKFGGKHKHLKNKKPEDSEEKKTVYAVEENGELYAVVNKGLGGSRIAITCSDKKERKAVIHGKFRKRVWMNPGDILLCCTNFNGKEDECAVLHKYTPHGIKNLRRKNLLNFVKNMDYDDEKENTKIEITERDTVDDILKGIDSSDEDSDEEYDDYDDIDDL